MKKAFILSFCIMAIACSKSLELDADISITSEEREVMDDCNMNQLDSEEAILDNLIGDWELVGYGCGFCMPHTPPQIDLKILSQQIIITLNESDSTSIETVAYNLESSQNGFRLVTDPSNSALRMEVFCDDYMYFDDTPVDGRMMLYRKK